jgi:undecaprenyl diphosphate synthase
VAIIMDGNRRYGTLKHGDALQGHADGGQTLVDCVQWCLEAGVGALTVYAFSTENWARPPAEVDLLMSIFVKYAARCEEEALKNNLVRLCWLLPHCVQCPQQRGRLLLSPQP